MIGLRKLVKRTMGITMSVLMTVSMMQVPVYALDDSAGELTVMAVEGMVIVNNEISESLVDRSDEDFSHVSVGNGLTYIIDLSGSQLDISVGDVEYDHGGDEDEAAGAAVEIGSYYGEDISTDIHGGNITSCTDGIDIFTMTGDVEATVGNINAQENGAYLENHGGDVTVAAGNIQAGEAGVCVKLDENEDMDAKATVTVGNIQAGEDGVYVGLYEGTEAAVTAGNIQAGLGGVFVDLSEGAEAAVTAGDIQAGQDGVYVNLFEGAEAAVTAGNIQADESGIYVENEVGNAMVTSGSIDADAFGIYTYGYEGNGNTDIEVNGNVTAGEGFYEEEYDEEEDEGVYVAKAGIYTYSEAGNTNNIKVNGDVTGSIGINVEGTSSLTNMTIDGNVSGSGIYLEETEFHIPGVGILYNYMNAPTDNGDDKLNVLVTDTVSGSEDGVGVVTSDDGSDFTLTTWKITPSTDKFAVGENIVAARMNSSEGYDFVENEEFEKSIQYIVKIDPAEVAGVSSLGATKEDGSALDKEGDYEWAHEGDTLLLKVELQDGYELTNAYGKKNQSYPFTKDQSGNYYITVPRGGGIFISVETALKPVEPDEPVDPDEPVNPVINVEVVDDESSNDNPPTAWGAVADTVDPVIFNSSIIRMVTDAAPGANVTVAAAGNTMISKEVVDTLSARPDVTLTITYIIDGVMYSVTIPAGTNLNFYRNAAGGIDIFKLVQLFGAIVVG